MYLVLYIVTKSIRTTNNTSLTCKVEVPGWSNLDGPLSFLPDLDADSDDEAEDVPANEGDDDMNVEENREAGPSRKLKVR